MKTARNRLNIESVPDFFGPETLARILGIAATKAYQLARSEGFPCRRIGRKLIISKTGFLHWFEENYNK